MKKFDPRSAVRLGQWSSHCDAQGCVRAARAGAGGGGEKKRPRARASREQTAARRTFATPKNMSACMVPSVEEIGRPPSCAPDVNIARQPFLRGR